MVVRNPHELGGFAANSRGPRDNATVEKPATADELARRLHEAAESGLAVFPVGGGRSLEMGDPPAVDGVELRTKALDRVPCSSIHRLTWW